jgi:hypothetical protein
MTAPTNDPARGRHLGGAPAAAPSAQGDDDPTIPVQQPLVVDDRDADE